MGAAPGQSAQNCLPKKVDNTPPDSTWIFRLGDKGWREQIKSAANDYKFRKTLGPRLDIAERDWHEKQPPNIPPPISKGLRLTAPWKTTDDKNDPAP